MEGVILVFFLGKYVGKKIDPGGGGGIRGFSYMFTDDTYAGYTRYGHNLELRRWEG